MEAMNPTRDLYGEERLTELLGTRECSSPEDLISAIIGSVEEFAAGAEQSDDITLLTLTCNQPDQSDHLYDHHPGDVEPSAL